VVIGFPQVHFNANDRGSEGKMIAVAIVSFVAACLLGAGLTALVIRLAPRIGLVDRPDQRRKLHVESMPLGGGAAVFLAVALVLGALVLLPGPWQFRINEAWWNLVGAFAACTWIVAVGLVDDRFGMRGRQKIAAQVVGAGILIGCGVLIEKIGVFGLVFDLGPLCVPITLFWLVGAMNALNLLDGMDGLATVLGIIVSLAICALALLSHHAGVSLAALVFAGALVGFLPFNLAPARVYLGDAGSMLIGLMVGGLSIRASIKGPGTMFLAAPLALLTLPILDSTAAILRRKLAGRSLYETDRGHLHHRLLERFGSKSKALVCVSICAAVTCAAALVGTLIKNDLVALVAAGSVVLMLITSGLFGRGEFGLLAIRTRDMVVSLVRPADPRFRRALETTARFQGSRAWDVLWSTLTESADKLQLTRIDLDLNVPAIAEGYHASWTRNGRNGQENEWRLRLPLAVAGHTAGSLTIAGLRDEESPCPGIELVVEMVEPFESRLRELTFDDIIATVGERRHASSANCA
jgi:UDP-GlcNAc:undecaprenyl-phosphate GlcNAc-1-phosphate transferase